MCPVGEVYRSGQGPEQILPLPVVASTVTVRGHSARPDIRLVNDTHDPTSNISLNTCLVNVAQPSNI